MERQIRQLSEALGAPMADTSVASLARFASLVSTWNAKLNLTGAKDDASLAEVLFADAIMLARDELVSRGAKVVDVGSGAGAPAIPFAILREDLSFVLVEPIHKRVAFMRTAIGALGLASRVTVVEGRIDPRAPSLAQGPFDVAMSRATLAPAEWLPVGLALAPIALVLTGAEEPPSAPSTHSVRYSLPARNSPRAITRYSR